MGRLVGLTYRVCAGDNVDCWMEIQHGKGPWAPPVSGIVPLGSTLTLVVAINDYRGKTNQKTRFLPESSRFPMLLMTLLGLFRFPFV